MPAIDHTPIAGLSSHTSRETFGDGGHLSNTLYCHDLDVWASKHDDGQISVNISGGGGSSSMVFSPEQWDLIIAHVNAVRALVAA
jgi:hypothetical protein